MPDANSLILLPPRPTAQAPQKSSSNQSSRPSGDNSFEQKLQKAKKHSVHATVKKQIAETPVKAVAVKASAKGAPKQTQSATQTQTTSTPGKTTPAVAKQSDDSDEQSQQTAAESKELPDLENRATAEMVVDKKPVKPQKTAVGRGNQPGTDPKLTGIVHPQPDQKLGKSKVDAGDDTDSTEGKTVVTPVVADSTDDETGDDANSPDAEFGTGKIVPGGAAAQKNAAETADASDSAGNASAAAAGAAASALPATELASVIDGTAAKPASKLGVQTAGTASPTSAVGLASATNGPSGIAGKLPAAVPTPQARFVDENHPTIISSIQGQLLPHGGTLQMRLDPPELGALQVTVHMRDGVMTASFQTSNEDATKLLSHSLGQLKSGLEAAGVSVDKIHVEQAPKKDSSGDSEGDGKQPPQEQQRQAQQDQQRREMVRQMWRKLAGGDPLDLVA